MGEVIYPQGLLTKRSTLICFPSIRKRRQNSQLFSKVLVHHCPCFLCAQSVVAKSPNLFFFFLVSPPRLCMLPSSPNKSAFRGQRVNVCQAILLLSPFGFFYFLSSALQFASCKITHSAALLIGSGEASSRFKWKCRVCPE